MSGLTPGLYLVQAALDDIWLSPGVRIDVKDQAAERVQDLDIGAPGVATVVQCVDAGGKPVAGAKAKVQRPAGPLSEQLWNLEFVADAAGVMHIPPLEAGEHVLLFEGQAGEQRFTVAPIVDKNAEPGAITVEMK